MKIDGEVYRDQGTGNGAYDAFTDALDKILLANTSIRRPHLLDYQVHIPRGGKTDALTEAAITWKLADNRTVTTRGVNSNQVFAAIQATLKVVNMLL